MEDDRGGFALTTFGCRRWIRLPARATRQCGATGVAAPAKKGAIQSGLGAPTHRRRGFQTRKPLWGS